MKYPRKLPGSRLPRWLSWQVLVLAGAALLVAGGLWRFATHVPAGPGALSRSAARRVSADIRRAQGTVAADTPRATAALRAGRTHLDSARAHARQAIHYHQQAKSHAHPSSPALPAPGASAAAGELERQLAGH